MTRPKSTTEPLADRILKACLDRADSSGWDSLTLHEIADDLGCSLVEVRNCYQDKDAVANAWFQQAQREMLAVSKEAMAGLEAPERLIFLLKSWIAVLQRHRGASLDMLKGKLYPSHPHHWVPLIFDLSRFVHWLRDAALLKATGRQRQVEEIGLTALVLGTLAVWSRDASQDMARTHRHIERRLKMADRLMARRFRQSREREHKSAA
ncbi:MAG: hypothetical protein AAF530_08360 [Pseudomonadota bacterium]